MDKETKLSEARDQAKAEFVRAKDRLTQILAKTPDDRLNWSPSATCRTPIQQVAHSAMAISGIHGMLTGKGNMPENLAEFDATMREGEKQFTTREQALELLEKNSAEYLAWMDTLTDEKLSTIIDSPMGPLPLSVGITFAGFHTRGHTAQLEYIQTIYGDCNWYM